MKLWEKKKDKESLVMNRKPHFMKQSINPVAKPCKFEEVAEDLIETELKPVERYAVKRYIMELKEHEELKYNTII